MQVYKTTGEFQQGTANDNGNDNSQQEQEQKQDEGEGGHGHPHPQYLVHLNRTSGPQLPYLSICSQLSSRLRRQHNNI
jgi:hypothetical protein